MTSTEAATSTASEGFGAGTIAVIASLVVVTGLSLTDLVLYFRFDKAFLPPDLEVWADAAHALWRCTPIAVASVASLIALRRPGHRLSVLLSLAAVLAGLATLAATYGRLAAIQNRYVVVAGWVLDARWGEFALWFASWALVVALGLVTSVLFLLFPDGHLPSRRWRIAAVLVGAVIAAAALRGAFGPTSLAALRRFEVDWFDFLAAQLSVFGRRTELVSIAFYAGIAVGACCLGWRYRHADHEERLQLKWVASAASLVAAAHVAAPVLHLAGRLTPGLAVQLGVATAAVRMALPIAIGIAILRYRLYGIDAVLTRTIVFGAMSLFITVAYVGVASGVGAVLTEAGSLGSLSSVIAMGPVAVGFAPIRSRTQRLANRVVYGERAEPYEVLARFATSLPREFHGNEIVSQLASAVGTGLGANRVEVHLHHQDGTERVAAFTADGDAVTGGDRDDRGPDLTVPIQLRGERIGHLVVVKAPGEVATVVDRRLLRLLASYAAVALQNVRIATELEDHRDELARTAAAVAESRRRIVTAHFDARRGVEEDIQRNVVHSLARVPEVLARLSKGEPEPILDEAAVATTSALDGLRAIAHGVFSPLVEALGVPSALESHLRDARVAAVVRTNHPNADPPRLEPVSAAALYSCCVDLVRAAGGRSGAGPLDLRFDVIGKWFELRLAGPSFDPFADIDRWLLRDLGDRLEAVGGRLDVTYAGGVHGVVVANVPIAERQAA